VGLLYRGALAPDHARLAMVNELSQSLDHQRGGVLSRNLSHLYADTQQRLLEANSAQTDEPLAEVQDLLKTLAEAWMEIRPTPAPVPSPPLEASLPGGTGFSL
jgi:flagellin-specific chaperone FliS